MTSCEEALAYKKKARAALRLSAAEHDAQRGAVSTDMVGLTILRARLLNNLKRLKTLDAEIEELTPDDQLEEDSECRRVFWGDTVDTVVD